MRTTLSAIAGLLLLLTSANALADVDDAILETMKGQAIILVLADGEEVSGQLVGWTPEFVVVTLPDGELRSLRRTLLDRVRVPTRDRSREPARAQPAPTQNDDWASDRDERGSQDRRTRRQVKRARFHDNGFQIEQGARVVVMPFRDNPSPDPDDRIDSGRHFSSSFVQGYRHRGIEAKEATIEDHDPSRQVSREEAARLARETGADYALRGACTEFYHCLWIVPRTDRAGTEVELVSKRGEVVFSGSVHRRAWSLARPEGMSRRVARLLVDDMRSTLSSQGIRRARTTQAWGIALTTIGGLALSSAIGLTAWLEWEGWMAIGLPAIPTLIPGIFMIVKSHQTLRRGFAVAPTVGGVAVAGQF